MVGGNDVRVVGGLGYLFNWRFYDRSNLFRGDLIDTGGGGL